MNSPEKNTAEADMNTASSRGSVRSSTSSELVAAAPQATTHCCQTCPRIESRNKIYSPKVFDLGPGEMLFDYEGRTVSSQSLSTFLLLLKASSVHNMFFNHFQVMQRDSLRCHSSFVQHSEANRYADIQCIEETRVKARHPTEGHDYIHANWVDGFREKKKFIITQAPMPHTMDHFWSMIFDQKALLVVSMIQMYTVKEPEISLRYIPLKSGETFKAGDITVTHCGTRRVRDTYDATVLKIRKENGGERKLLHLNYFGWGYKGTPTRPTELLNMMTDMNHNREKLRKESIKAGWLAEGDPASIVIHCLAGTGRSCTVVALDILCRKMDATHQKSGEAVLDVEDTVLRMRTQRAMAVQKAEQYMLLHFSSVEYALRQGYVPSEAVADVNFDNFKYTASTGDTNSSGKSESR